MNPSFSAKIDCSNILEKCVFDQGETVEKSIFSKFQNIIIEELREVKEDVKGVSVEMPVLRALKGKFLMRWNININLKCPN